MEQSRIGWHSARFVVPGNQSPALEKCVRYGQIAMPEMIPVVKLQDHGIVALPKVHQKSRFCLSVKGAIRKRAVGPGAVLR